MTSDTTIRDLYELIYRPARHAGERHRRTRAEARTQINNLNRWWHAYSAEQGRPLGAFTLRLFDELGDDAIALAMAWLVDEGRKPARAPATANKLRATINAMWELANERGLVTSRPRNKKFRCDLEDPIALTPDEKAAVIAQAERVPGAVGDVPACDWWLMFVLLLFNSAARITVLTHAPTAGLDLSRGELLLPARWQKQRKDQRVALWQSTRRQLVALRVVERRLVHVLDDFPFNVDTLRDHYSDRVLQPAGIPTDSKHKFHCCRKTVASEVKARKGIGTAKEILGHSSESVTLRYIDPRYEERPRVPEIVPDPLPDLPGPRLGMYRGEAG